MDAASGTAMVALSRRRSLARQANPQVSQADFNLGEIVLLHDLREPVDGDRVNKALR